MQGKHNHEGQVSQEQFEEFKEGLWKWLTVMEKTARDNLAESRITNGKVAELSKWRWYSAGAVTMLAFLVSIFGVFVISRAEPTPISVRDYDCAEFESQSDAQEYLLPGDPFGLDADKDGIACEGLR